MIMYLHWCRTNRLVFPFLYAILHLSTCQHLITEIGISDECLPAQPISPFAIIRFIMECISIRQVKRSHLSSLPVPHLHDYNTQAE